MAFGLQAFEPKAAGGDPLFPVIAPAEHLGEFVVQVLDAFLIEGRDLLGGFFLPRVLLGHPLKMRQGGMSQLKAGVAFVPGLVRSVTPSQRASQGSDNPWKTSVERMTQNVRKLTRPRSGKGRPSPNVIGNASAAAKETTPRIPLQATTSMWRQGGIGSRCRNRWLSKRGNQVAGKTHMGRTRITTALITAP